LHLGAVFVSDLFSGLTESLRASTVKRTAGVDVGGNGSACNGRIDPVLLRGRGEQAAFPT
jgi:hypothetical protein